MNELRYYCATTVGASIINHKPYAGNFNALIMQ